jgi:hypothetical protein
LNNVILATLPPSIKTGQLYRAACGRRDFGVHGTPHIFLNMFQKVTHEQLVLSRQ